MSLDQFTFGNEMAAINLADMLNKHNNPRVTVRVSLYLSKNNRLLRDVSSIDDIHSRVSLYSLILAKNQADQFKGMPEQIATHVKNVAITSVRKYMRIDVDAIKTGIAESARQRAITKKLRNFE